jgi:hypothetical protein
VLEVEHRTDFKDQSAGRMPQGWRSALILFHHLFDILHRRVAIA